MAPDPHLSSPDLTTAASVGGGLGERVGQILERHREGIDGWCEGCVDDGILRFHPCPSAMWAGNLRGEEQSGRYYGGTPGARRSP